MVTRRKKPMVDYKIVSLSLTDLRAKCEVNEANQRDLDAYQDFGIQFNDDAEGNKTSRITFGSHSTAEVQEFILSLVNVDDETKVVSFTQISPSAAIAIEGSDKYLLLDGNSRYAVAKRLVGCEDVIKAHGYTLDTSAAIGLTVHPEGSSASLQKALSPIQFNRAVQFTPLAEYLQVAKVIQAFTDANGRKPNRPEVMKLTSKSDKSARVYMQFADYATDEDVAIIEEKQIGLVTYIKSIFNNIYTGNEGAVDKIRDLFKTLTLAPTNVGAVAAAEICESFANEIASAYPGKKNPQMTPEHLEAFELWITLVNDHIDTVTLAVSPVAEANKYLREALGLNAAPTPEPTSTTVEAGINTNGDSATGQSEDSSLSYDVNADNASDEADTFDISPDIRVQVKTRLTDIIADIGDGVTEDNFQPFPIIIKSLQLFVNNPQAFADYEDAVKDLARATINLYGQLNLDQLSDSTVKSLAKTIGYKLPKPKVVSTETTVEPSSDTEKVATAPDTQTELMVEPLIPVS